MLNVKQKLLHLLPTIKPAGFAVLCVVADKMDAKGIARGHYCTPSAVWKAAGMGKNAYYTAMRVLEQQNLLHHNKPCKNSDGVYTSQGYKVNLDYIGVFVPAKLAADRVPETGTRGTSPRTRKPQADNGHAIRVLKESISISTNKTTAGAVVVDTTKKITSKNQKQKKVKKEKKVAPKKQKAFKQNEVFLCMDAYQSFYNTMQQLCSPRELVYKFNFNASKKDAGQMKTVCARLLTQYQQNNTAAEVPTGENFANEIFTPFLRVWYRMHITGDYWYTKNFLPSKLSAHFAQACTDMQTYLNDEETTKGTNPATRKGGGTHNRKKGTNNAKFAAALQSNIEKLRDKYTTNPEGISKLSNQNINI